VAQLDRHSARLQIYNVKQGLGENGLVDGRDYVLDTHFAAGDYELFPEMTRKLMLAGARMLLVNTIASARRTERRSAGSGSHGLVASLARRGGHTTGMATLNEDITVKTIGFQLEVVPKATAIAAVFNPADASKPAFHCQTQRGCGRERDDGAALRVEITR
jgi:putative ABC transport system substrate-binding protein